MRRHGAGRGAFLVLTWMIAAGLLLAVLVWVLMFVLFAVAVIAGWRLGVMINRRFRERELR